MGRAPEENSGRVFFLPALQDPCNDCIEILRHFTRTSIRISSREAGAILTAVETRADAVVTLERGAKILARFSSK